jgi:hypothetical protein
MGLFDSLNPFKGGGSTSTGGFFGSGGKSSTTQSLTQTSNVSTGFEGIEGPAVSGDVGTINVLDGGAQRLAADVALEALAVTEEGQRGARQLVNSAVSEVLGFGESALTFADRSNARLFETADAANSRIADIADVSSQRSLQFASTLFGDTNELIRDAYSDAFGLAGNVLKEGQAQVATTVENVNAIARQQSTSDAERFQDIVKWALGAAAVMVGVFAFGKGAR